MTETHIAFMAAYPVWMSAVWAIGVWSGAPAACCSCSARRALWAFVVSLAAILASVVYAFGATGRAEVMNSTISLVIAAAGAFFIWYAWAMSRAGVLR